MALKGGITYLAIDAIDPALSQKPVCGGKKINTTLTVTVGMISIFHAMYRHLRKAHIP